MPARRSMSETWEQLRASFGDRIGLVAVLPGPAAVAGRCMVGSAAAADGEAAPGKELLAAGADVVLVNGISELPGAPLSTLASVGTLP
jgi:hypothetical protein